MAPTTTDRSAPRTLSTAEERREAVLEAAMRVFAARGFHGTPTTETSQPLHFIALVILANAVVDTGAWLLNALGFMAASVAILRLSDDEWELPSIPR